MCICSGLVVYYKVKSASCFLFLDHFVKSFNLQDIYKPTVSLSIMRCLVKYGSVHIAAFYQHYLVPINLYDM